MLFQLFSVFQDISAQLQKLAQKPQSGYLKAEKQPFDYSFFTNILSCEEQLHSHIYELNEVEQLLNGYSQLVEYFDGTVGVKSYFLEKIQFLLSRPETVKLLLKKHDEQQYQFSESSSQRLSKNQDFERFKNLDDTPRVRYSIHKKKFDRSTQIKIFIDLQESKDGCDKDLKMLLKEYEETSKEYDKLIKESLEQQDSLMKEKLRQRSGKKGEAIRRSDIRAFSAEKGGRRVSIRQQLPEESMRQINNINTKNSEGKPDSQISIKARNKFVNEVEEGVSFMRKSICQITQRKQNKERQNSII